jgi:hypothetical protein
MNKLKNCSAPYCKGTASKGDQCSKHRQREYRKNNPIKAAFQNLRSNASRRGKDFSLTFEQFKSFAIETDYIAGKGRTVESYHIDRIDENQGYHVWNIQVLTNSENVKKYHELKYNKDERGAPYVYWVEPLRMPFTPVAFAEGAF